jgi:predicted Zn-dependent protease
MFVDSQLLTQRLARLGACVMLQLLLSPFSWAATAELPLWPRLHWQAQQERLQQTPAPRLADLQQLLQQFTQQLKANNTQAAADLLAQNFHLVRQAPQAPETAALMHWALRWDWLVPLQNAQVDAQEKGQWAAAQHWNNLLADYYLQQEQLDQAQALMPAQQQFDPGKGPTADYYWLLQGGLLQAQKKHRAAISLYQKIPPQSPHYGLAQRNLSGAYMRQGWWSDALQALKAAQLAQKNQQNEFTNHLHVTRGLINLKSGFYKDASNDFKRVTQDSLYARRAAMGLGLALLEQKKYADAAAVFNHVKSAEQLDINTAEAYLLFAVTTQHKGDSNKAIALFKEAIGWYETQLLQHAQLKNQLLNPITSREALQQLHSRLRQLPLPNPQAERLLQRHAQWLFWQDQPLSSALKTALKTYHDQEYNALQQALNAWVQDNSNAISTYLSNSRYGLANTYDTQPSQR